MLTRAAQQVYLGRIKRALDSANQVAKQATRDTLRCVYTDCEGAMIITHNRMVDVSEEYIFHGHVDHLLYALTLGRRLGIASPRNDFLIIKAGGVGNARDLNHGFLK